MIVQDRDASRRVFVETWTKSSSGVMLTALEQLVLTVIQQHPEYHRWLEDEHVLHRDFSAETGADNPFLHMGMHIAMIEQISTDRPSGVSACYQILLGKHRDEHKLQHRMMECLGRSLWQAQLNRSMPDESAYLECLRNLG